MSISVRSQRIVAHYGLIIGIILVVLGAVSLGGAWFIFSNPPTNQVSEQINQQRVAATVDTRAVVTGENQTLYEQGTVLENQPVYLFSASPNMTIQITTSVPQDVLVSVDQRLSLQLTASRNNEVFWSEQHLLGHSSEEVRDGESVMNASTNMTAIRGVISDRRGEIGDIGTFSTVFNLTIAYDTGKYSGRLDQTTSIVLVNQGYWLGGDLSGSQSHSETVTRQETGSPNMEQVFISGGLGLLMVLIGVALGVLYVRAPSVERLETLIARSRYDEWISNGEIPTKSEKEYVRIETLEDLVDIAIDQNKRVIFDQNYDTYAVIEGDLVYYYATGEQAFDEWLEV